MPHPVHEHFFFFRPPGAKGFYGPLDNLQATLAPLLVTPATVFRHNLRAVIETARLPVRLVSAEVYERRLSALHTAEAIRLHSFVKGPETPKERAAREQEALKRARVDFQGRLMTLVK